MRYVVATALIATIAGCGDTRRGPDAYLADSLASISRRFSDSLSLPGLAVGVLRGDSILYRGGFGTTVAGAGQSVTPATIFHLASVSKLFVATSVMQLVELGKVALDSAVTVYLPTFRMKDPKARGITVRQILMHVAGLPDVTDYAWSRPEYDDGALGRYVAGLADSTLIAPPDERWQYSNIGFEILAHLVATVSGQSFESYVQQRILTPLRMTKSTFLMTDLDSSLMAAGHSRDSAQVNRPTGVYPYNRRHAGSSTLHSNVDDLLRFGLANLRHGALDGATILSPTTHQEMWKPGRDLTPMLVERARQAGMDVPYSEIRMGLGWFLPTRNGRRVAFHSGGDTGFSSDLLLAPDDSVAIVVMANTDGLALLNLGVKLLDAVVAGDAVMKRR